MYEIREGKKVWHGSNAKKKKYTHTGVVNMSTEEDKKTEQSKIFRIADFAINQKLASYRERCSGIHIALFQFV